MASAEIQRQFVQGLISIGILALTLLQVLITLCLLPLRASIKLLATLYRPDLDKMLSGLDNTYSCLPSLNIVYYMYANGHLSLQVNQAHMKKIVYADTNQQMYERLMMTWTSFCGYMFWKEDPDFKIENHFREYDHIGKLELPKNVMKEDATRVMGGLSEAHWKECRSPWESFLIPLSGKSGETLWIFRHHHALMDGFSAIGFLKEVTQTDYKFCPSKKYTSRNYKSLLYSALRLPFDFVGMQLQKIYLKDNWDLLTAKGPREFVTTAVKSITVEKAKAARHKLGTAYVPTVLAILGGGLERLFKEVNQPVPKYLITAFPHPLPGHPGGLVNHMVSTNFPWRIQANSAVERAQEIESEINKLSSPEMITVQSILAQITGTLPAFILKPLSSYNMSGCSVGASIFPVFDAIEMPTSNPIQYMEAAVGAPAKNMGAIIISCGINGDQRIVLNMDRRVFKDDKCFQLFGKYVEEELESILSSAGENLPISRSYNWRMMSHSH